MAHPSAKKLALPCCRISPEAVCHSRNAISHPKTRSLKGLEERFETASNGLCKEKAI
jgi:hypothetical protein